MAAAPVAIRGLVPEDEVLRAILSSKALLNLPDAFMLRTGENGLSVSFDCTAADCRALFNTTHGVARLIVASILELQLQIVPDEPNHANVIGIPHKEDDPDRAEWFANRLAERAVVVDRGKITRPK